MDDLAAFKELINAAWSPAAYMDNIDYLTAVAPDKLAKLVARLERAERELHWWQDFHLSIEAGGDMPKVGSAILGRRYQVTDSYRG